MLLLAIPILLAGVMWLVGDQARKRSEAVQHTQLIQITLERLMLDLKDAESGQQGYLATGEQRFLEGYTGAIDALQTDFASLSSLTSDNLRQTESLARMKPLLEQRFEHLQSRMDLQTQPGSSIPLDSRTARDQSALLGLIQTIANDMYREEQRLFEAREGALIRANHRFLWSLFAGYGLIVLIVGSLHRSVKRHSLETARARERLQRLNAQLDERVQLRTAELYAREELLNIFVRYVPAAVAMLDRQMRYLQVSERWCTDYKLPRERFIGNCNYDLFPDLPGVWREIHQRCLAGENLRSEEDQWHRADGRIVWLRWEIRPWGNRNGLPEGLLVFTEDITERKQMENALRESEATTRTLLETASQAILAADSTGTIAIANHKAEEMFGYATGELPGQVIELLIPPKLRNVHQLHRATFHENPQSRAMGIGLDLIGCRKNGSEFPIEVSLSSVQTKRGLLAVSFVSDITERKRAENDLKESEQQLRALAGSLLSIQEEERRTLARELHDDVTQQLAFLAIELGRLATELPDATDTRSHVLALQSQITRASSEVRRISHGLHPSVIIDFGLGVALEEFCDEFQSAHNVRIEFEGLVEDSDLNDAGATCLYRIAQESLRNAVVHGKAKNIFVTLSLSDGFLELRVADDGIGFSMELGRSKTGLGVISMMERIRLVQGTLKLSLRPGGGTVVTASVPRMLWLHAEM